MLTVIGIRTKHLVSKLYLDQGDSFVDKGLSWSRILRIPSFSGSSRMIDSYLRMASCLRIGIEKFSGQNVELWKIKMENLLVDQEHWIFMDRGMKPIGTSQDDWDKLEG